jgi:hypothetical protein
VYSISNVDAVQEEYKPIPMHETHLPVESRLCQEPVVARYPPQAAEVAMLPLLISFCVLKVVPG